MNVKRSKLQRKYVNAMRGMADVPWPARRFKYPPTFGNQRSRAIVRKWRRGGPNTMPAPRRIPDSRRALQRRNVIYMPGKRERLEAKPSILSRLFNRRSAK